MAMGSIYSSIALVDLIMETLSSGHSAMTGDRCDEARCVGQVQRDQARSVPRIYEGRL